MSSIKNQERIRRALDHIEKNGCAGISLSELAALACMSRHHFAREFRAITGKTPMACVAEAKIKCARKHLGAAVMTIAVVAVLCGFSSQSHMTRAFRNATGETPAAFQRRVVSPQE